MKAIIIGPLTITLSADEERVYLLVQDEDGRAINFSQDIMPGDGPYSTRWAMEMMLRRFIATNFDKFIVKPRKKLDIEID